MTRISPLLLLLAAGLATAALPAQEPFLEITGDPWENLGMDVAIVGDINADGFDDIATTVEGNRTGSDYLRAYSGQDGSLLNEWRISGSAGNVAGLGDLDQDGFDDLLHVGGPLWGTSILGVVALSGRDGTPIWSWEPASPEYLDPGYSQAVDTAGDLDGDGFPDVLVNGEDRATYLSVGLVFAISGRDGSLLYTIRSDQDPAWAATWNPSFGDSLAFLGDMDGDGKDDFAVGDHHSDINGSDSGLVLFFSGADGSVIRLIPGPPSPGWPNEPQFGFQVIGPGDVNADGVPDLITGTLGGAGVAETLVLSGSDLSPLYVFQGNQVGWVARVGDVNEDGFADFGKTHYGQFQILSGRDGGLMAIHGLRWGDIDAGGDLDADGRPDIAFADFTAGPQQRGKVTVAPLAPWLETGPVVAGQTATVSARAFHGGSPAALAASLAGPGSTWFPTWEVMLDLANPVALAGPSPTDATGAVSWTLPVPAGAAGVPVWLQAVQQWHRSNVVAVVVQ